MSRIRRRAIRVSASIAIATLATGCATWHPITGPMPHATFSDPAPEVRLQLWSGSSMLMYNPEIKGDSIVGYDRPSFPEKDNYIAVHKSDVQGVAVKRTSLSSVVLIGGAAFLALMMISAGAFGTP